MGKRGRNRKSGKREPNGKPQRSSRRDAEQNVMGAAVEYRQRVFGVSPRDVMDQKAATLLGRLCLRGTVSEAQWQAGEDWLRIVNARHAAANAPRGFRTAGSAAFALDDAEEAARYQAIKDAFDAANDAIEDHAPVTERVARMRAISTIVVQEFDRPEMYGALRTALNGLVKHFKTDAKAA